MSYYGTVLQIGDELRMWYLGCTRCMWKPCKPEQNHEVNPTRVFDLDDFLFAVHVFDEEIRHVAALVLLAVASELVERAATFHAVKFLGLPIHRQFDDFQAVGGRGQQALLRGRMQVCGRAGQQVRGQVAGAGHHRLLCQPPQSPRVANAVGFPAISQCRNN